MKKIIATLGLIGVLLISVPTVNAGILVGDFQGSDTRQTCKENRGDSKTNTDWAIFVTALAGSIYSGFAGTFTFEGFIRGSGITRNAANCGS